MEDKERYRLLLRHLPDAFAHYRILTDERGDVVDCEIVEVNPAFEAMAGIETEAYLGKRITEIYPAIASEPFDWFAACGRVAAGGGSICQEYHYKRVGRWLEITAYSDLPGYFATVFRDITESKRYKKELEKTLYYLEYVMRATQTGIDIIDKEFNLLYVDELWKDLYGDPVGCRCYEYFKNLEEPCENCGASSALQTKEVVRFEQILPREGHRVVECHAVPFKDEQGEWLLADFKTDITARKQLEEKLRFQLQFEKMVSAIASSFVDIDEQQIEGMIGRSLQQFGEFFRVDRGVIFRLSPAGEAMISTHEWCAAGVKPLAGPFKRFSVNELPWLYTRVQAIEHYYSADVERLPPEAAAEKESFASQGIQSFLILPFSRNEAGLVNGFLAFDSIREKRRWTEEQINLLNIVAGVIDGAFTRQQLERERNEALKMLRESEENLSTTLNSIGDGVIATDAGGRITRLNPRAENLTGWSREEAVGRPLEEVFRVVNMKTGEPVCNPVKRVLESGETVALANDSALIARDGTSCQISDSAAPIRDNGGELCGVVMVFFDITVQYQAREELQKSEARYRTIVENVIEALLIFDFQMKIRDLNENAYRMLGYEREELLGANMAMITGAEDQKREPELMRKLLTDGRLLFEGVLLHREGSPIPVEVSLKVVSREGGGLVQGFIRDITQRRQDEQQIARYTAELEYLYRQLDQEMDRAREVHKRTLPKRLPSVKGISLAAHYQPAAMLGGDFYDVVKLGNKLIIYLSDVTGHGADGAMLSLFVKHTIKGFLSFSPEKSICPENILRYLSIQFQQKNLSEDYFICIFLAILDLETRELTYTAAGFQDSPLVRLGNGEQVKLVSRGLFISPAFSDDLLNLQESSIELTPGSTVLFNTDGLTEQQGAGGLHYGERLPGVFYGHSDLPPRQIVQIICDDFQKFNGGSRQGNDDITFLVLQIDAGPKKSEFLELSTDLTELSDLREKIFARLDNGRQKDLFLTCLHELVSNAMEHGNRLEREKPVSVEFVITDRFYLASVKDRGEGFDWREHAERPLELEGISERGRGIALVRMCSDRLFYNEKGNRATFIIYR